MQDKKLNICLISREFPPETAWGGIATFSLDIAKLLNNAGHEVTVFSQTLKNENTIEYFEGIKVVRIKIHNKFMPIWYKNLPKFILFYNYFIFRKILAFHKIKKFDILLTQDHLAEGLLPSIFKVIPVITFMHTPFSLMVDLELNNYKKNLSYSLIKIFEKIAYKRSNVLCFATNNLAELTFKYFNFFREFKLIEYPIDIELFKPNDNFTFQKKVLFLGRLEQRKGIEVLAESFVYLIKKDPDFLITIVGADTPNIQGYSSGKQFLVEYFNTHHCLDSVSFLPNVPINALPPLLNMHDFLWIPSLYDNSPLVCLEAMSCGKVSIVSDAGGGKEFYKIKDSGLVFRSKDSVQLAELTFNLTKNEEKRSLISANARKVALEHYSYPVVLKKILNMIYSTLN